MKLLITTITIFFISFGASALSVEELYKFCKPFQNNGFSLDNLSQNKVDKAFGCMAYIRGLAERGYVSCIYLRGFNKKELFEAKSRDKNQFGKRAYIDTKGWATADKGYLEDKTTDPKSMRYFVNSKLADKKNNRLWSINY